MMYVNYDVKIVCQECPDARPYEDSHNFVPGKLFCHILKIIMCSELGVLGCIHNTIHGRQTGWSEYLNRYLPTKAP